MLNGMECNVGVLSSNVLERTGKNESEILMKGIKWMNGMECNEMG